MSFENASVIITGGSKGIGLSIAKVFARKTDRTLVLIARNENELENARHVCLSEGAKKVDILSVDITDPSSISNIDFGNMNPGVLVNNAGSYLYNTLQKTSLIQFKEQFQINTVGAFNITQSILPELHKRDRGLIVNICSHASIKGFGDSGAYAMSKHAMLGYSRSLRAELMDSKIAVSAINLGQTFSTSWKDIDVNPNDLIDPEDVGQIIVSLSELSPRSVADEIILSAQGGNVDPI